ncbi:SDR family NAD(P)-dependent oxidoreductase [Amycolatopsis jiangsuensis]|uniref:3-oxoacyl-[acyl-carrier protein] reductase n=1 Tax=Amycolatopsis jiangsuensis TaxID=1181879 RepID=A0A840J4I9_9PSEU|nr:SDR family NAD(P)-dependent oxidoreductase [Amycolatopsis jiangsuensis]MBB4688332.1 3-oxoacyl-[acyl-carrier protein] reductase [Amycolatopsis jiangsuensis]
MNFPSGQGVHDRPAAGDGIDGLRVVVVGAGNGIGAGVAELLLDSGAVVVGSDLPAVRPSLPGLAGWLPVDLTDPPSVREMVDNAVHTLGRIDGVVNCAGILGDPAPAAEEPIHHFEHVLRVNLTGAFALSQAVLPVMAAAGYGRLLHLASMAGKDGNAAMTGYSASKAGLMGMVKALGKEYATTGVTVNAVAPTMVETTLIRGMSDEQVAHLRTLIPMGRLGKVSEVAALVRWAISPAASFTTGFTYDLSGGRATY